MSARRQLELLPLEPLYVQGAAKALARNAPRVPRRCKGWYRTFLVEVFEGGRWLPSEPMSYSKARAVAGERALEGHRARLVDQLGQASGEVPATAQAATWWGDDVS